MRRFGFAAAVVGLAAVTAAGQEAVTIKAPQLRAGDKVRVTKTEKTTSTTTFAAGGQTQKKDDTTTRTIVYVDHVITAGEKGAKPVKLTRTYEKYEVSKGGEPTAPLNTPIAIEKKDGKYTFAADKPLDAGFSAKLAAEFDKAGPGAEAVLPGKPVKPGETWKLEGDKLKGLLGGADAGGVDVEKSAVTGKLVKAYQKDGKQFGVLEFTGTIAMKSLGEKVPFVVKPGSAMDVKMTLDGCIDGTLAPSETKGTLKVRLEAEGKGVTLTVTADGVTSETQEPVTK